jgi:hypothetical protein
VDSYYNSKSGTGKAFKIIIVSMTEIIVKNT